MSENKKTAALHNLGCKVNAYETEAMQQLLENAGYDIVDFQEKADVYIINTCTVTNIADRKSRQMLHKAKKMNPNAIVVAAGCYAQASAEKIKADESIDIILGNNMKKELVNVLDAYSKGEDAKALIDINHTMEYEKLELETSIEHTRAVIKVQDGCNQFCSYCIIPFARGRVRSRKKEDVVNEISNLAQKGFKEVVLTGIHLSSYGMDLENENLLSLILAVNEIEGIKRIRLGSLEPRIITEEFVSSISKLEKICPHFHLSLQSGCDETLKRMNRKYTAKEYYEGCMLLRKYFSNPAITTDVIVGFPQETDEEFEICKAFLEKVNFYEMHIFKYSKRQGTKAAKMDNQVDEKIKTKRSNELISMAKRQSEEFENSFIGRQLEVLIEESVEIDGNLYQIGHTKEYVKIAIQSDLDLSNEIIKVNAVKRIAPNVIFASMVTIQSHANGG